MFDQNSQRLFGRSCIYYNRYYSLTLHICSNKGIICAKYIARSAYIWSFVAFLCIANGKYSIVTNWVTKIRNFEPLECWLWISPWQYMWSSLCSLLLQQLNLVLHILMSVDLKTVSKQILKYPSWATNKWWLSTHWFLKKISQHCTWYLYNNKGYLNFIKNHKKRLRIKLEYPSSK